jgi:hypothetical protein
MNFSQLRQQFIAGEWRDGKSDNMLTDINPYNSEVITSFQMANIEDIDDAYQAAYKAKLEWDKVNAYKKRDILENAVKYIEAHEEEIASIIIQELGGTRLKAAFEIGLVKNMIKEAATFPLRLEGKILLLRKMEKRTGCTGSRPAWLGLSVRLTSFLLIDKVSCSSARCRKWRGAEAARGFTDYGGTLIGKIFEEAGIPKVY